MQNLTSYVYVDDGLIKQFRIAPVERLHPGLVFKAHPSIPADYNRMLYNVGMATKNDGPDAATIAQAEFLAKMIVEWDLKNGRGEVVPVGVEHALRMHPKLFDQATEIINGMRPSDPLQGEERGENNNAQRGHDRLRQLLGQSAEEEQGNLSTP